MRTSFVVLTLVFLASHPLDAQLSRVTFSGIPSWADSALRKAGIPGRYDLASTMHPDVESGDFDGDGFLDIVVKVVPAGSRQRGLAFVHRLDRSVHIVGAGQPLGNGSNELPSSAPWGVEHRWPYRDVVRVDGWGTMRGWLAWNGESYWWVQDSQ